MYAVVGFDGFFSRVCLHPSRQTWNKDTEWGLKLLGDLVKM
jgi:hypothetical protein